MPEGLKTGAAIKADTAAAAKHGEKLIESGKAKIADAGEAMKEEAGRVKDDGDKLIKAGRSKVAEAADAVKNAAVPPPEPTLYEKTIGKLLA